MAGKAQAVESGNNLRDSVAAVGESLGLEAEMEVSVGRRVWGARRRIDVVLKDRTTRVSLGIECKFQGTKGSAEEKIPATIEDIRAWPIRGIVVYSGEGFSVNMKSYLLSTGMAVELPDLKKWLELYFGL
jgi:PD-(D/E)XK nuclease superfamily domain